MLTVGFILPPSTNAKPFRQVPLTSLYLLTILQQYFKDSINISQIDLRGVTEENIKFYIPEKDVYFYTVMSPEWEDVKKIRFLIKEIYPKSINIAGGLHPYLFKQQCLKIFDSISVGDGQITIIQIIKDINKKCLKKIYDNEVESLIDPNDYPYPQRKFLPKTNITQTGLLVGKNSDLLTTDVLFSRWCPFKCSFCVNITHGPTKFRKPQLMIQQIQYLKREYDIKALVLKDDNGIPFQKNIARPFLEAIAKTDVKWRGQSRANGINEDTVKLAAQSGCTDIAIGIQSPNEKVLKMINKNIDLNEAKKYIRLLKKYNIGARLLLIMGLPGQDENIYNQMLNFVKQTQPTSVVLSLFSPYPGSPIMNDLNKYGIQLKPHSYRQLRNYFGRLNKDEKPQLFYKYKQNVPWGKPLSNDKILGYYQNLQGIFREKGLNF